MESGPAIFAGAVFTLFGVGLLAWTGTRALHRAPVAQGVNPVASVAFGAGVGVVALALGVWCFTRL
ncbi:hypothetical protein [Streptomyces boluensis]|uniref:Uncharacterized protein n=1 Tax=Streptomyces boluensis TaxID=1775135 RepID=A0A964UJJ6_9ACTN|nr:hypothetical protein [Streptomyces boluensis]NBE49842.1 hypothetical protein [Streptomyces boluensis]